MDFACIKIGERPGAVAHEYYGLSYLGDNIGGITIQSQPRQKICSRDPHLNKPGGAYLLFQL
jgi:hypothetical protein